MATYPPRIPTVALMTLGCAKNEADSRAMRNKLNEQGFAYSNDPETADVIVLNTCAFIESAIEESLDTILELSILERVQQGATKLVVTGCLPSRYGVNLRSELPEVSAFVPVSEEKDLGTVLAGLFDLDAEDLSTEQHQVEKVCVPSERAIAGATDDKQQVWAYVKISDGCSRHCAYCTIPSIRGPYHSYPFARIRSEVDTLVAEGVREIVLIGQDTGLWQEPLSNDASDTTCKKDALDDTALRSLDRGTPHDLASLLNALAVSYPQTWFRVMYLQPEGITNALLKVMKDRQNVASYLDIPLQHVSEELLAAMKRSGSSEQYLAMLEHIRSSVPEITLRTTLMVGFPGEKQHDFEQLCDFVQKARFDYVGIFSYSREEGTVAADLPQQVDRQTALQRHQTLRDLVDAISINKAEEQVGKTAEVLVCGYEDGVCYGRTQAQAPEVDGVVYLQLAETSLKTNADESALKLGTFIRARISASILYDLFAEAG